MEGMDVYYKRYFIVPKFPLFNPLFIFLALRGMITFFSREKGVESLDIHFAYPDGCVGVLCKKILGIRYTLTVRGSDIYVFHKRVVIGSLVGWALRESRVVVAVSASMANFVRKRFSVENVVVARNGVDTSIFRRADNKRAERERLGLPTDSKLILYVGSLIQHKGVLDLLKAFQSVKRRVPGALLVFIGKGPLAGRLKEEAGGGVLPLGPKSENEVSAYMRVADLLCLPSRSEGCPNVVLEALASGIPVVGTDIDGIREILVSEEFGALFTAGNSADLSDKLVAAMEKGWNADRIAQYGSTFDWGETYAVLKSRMGPEY